MKFKNKETGVIVVTTVKVIEDLYKNKSEYVEVKETKEAELSVKDIKAKLDELKIQYDPKAKKEDLLALLPQE